MGSWIPSELSFNTTSCSFGVDIANVFIDVFMYFLTIYSKLHVFQRSVKIIFALIYEKLDVNPYKAPGCNGIPPCLLRHWIFNMARYLFKIVCITKLTPLPYLLLIYIAISLLNSQPLHWSPFFPTNYNIFSNKVTICLYRKRYSDLFVTYLDQCKNSEYFEFDVS